MTEISTNRSMRIEAKEKEIIAVVGAGGKTTWIHQQAKMFQERGKRVLIITTTHMFVEEGMSLWNMNSSEKLRMHRNAMYNKDMHENNMHNNIYRNDSLLQQSIERLEKHEILVAGALCESCQENELSNFSSFRKFTSLPENILQILMTHADVVLIEADGSKRMPLKYPAEYEPVLRKDLTKVVIIMGKEGIGKRAEEVLQRWELAVFPARSKSEKNDLTRDIEKKYEIINKDTIVSYSMVLQLFEIYKKIINEMCPDVLTEKYLAEIIDGEMRYEQY